ncbi:hypothetical protein L202_00888 [Cryptococcus amylolentus CBS 6039]|uniref:V-SNARE coiled-coil homology domain-containing protein n=1 Tax=Cryptococcus amylolentus CBS 6039 TaxID=1295533 RepID=A0A1E3I8T5_9TREE|nr:hypothetical protein L202_00888 [Cryptococcus amylolentus CBS 6039]ODN85059.1 hypothetical protein L202_00888 [Cryptococcus amylolentus CBS 6039]
MSVEDESFASLLILVEPRPRAEPFEPSPQSRPYLPLSGFIEPEELFAGTRNHPLADSSSFSSPEQSQKPKQQAPQRQKIDNINKEIDATKYVLNKNIEMITERGERLEHLDQRTRTAQSFKTQAAATRRKMWWKNMKWTICIGVLVVIIIAGAVGGAVKGTQ